MARRGFVLPSFPRRNKVITRVLFEIPVWPSQLLPLGAEGVPGYCLLPSARCLLPPQPELRNSGQLLVGSGANRTSSLPKFWPLSNPWKAATAFSSPSTTSSRYFTFARAQPLDHVPLKIVFLGGEIGHNEALERQPLDQNCAHERGNAIDSARQPGGVVLLRSGHTRVPVQIDS